MIRPLGHALLIISAINRLFPQSRCQFAGERTYPCKNDGIYCAVSRFAKIILNNCNHTVNKLMHTG
ncbi:hypothetical protein HMPREF9086_2017 [Enterobacter hormaechei ATCC 49162]|nr:hypothetical protein HMPREF9086_2017 [Enterobacter hormaechei ATCC 49162]